MWGSHTIEFLSLGTAVLKTAGDVVLPVPTTIISLDNQQLMTATDILRPRPRPDSARRPSPPGSRSRTSRPVCAWDCDRSAWCRVTA